MISASKLTVLGGGSPFTAALLDAIADSDYRFHSQQLMLFGRHQAALDVVASRALHCLGRFGWLVKSTTNLAEALEGAQHVVHQIRYGGLDGREEGERIAELFGLPADETLGPAALQSAIRGAAAVKQTAECIAARCPDAWILNLTNPLSVTTAILIREGVTRCLGICELPEATAAAVAHLLGVEPAWLRWEYAGLNHRGFLYDFSLDGRSVMPEILHALPAGDLPGITRGDVESLQAVPLKYFSLGRGPTCTTRRAQVLRDLRVALLRELAHDPTTSPPSLRKRNLAWYAKAVVPLLTALATGDGRTHVVNLMGPDGVVIETRAKILANHVVATQASLPAPAVQSWIRRFAAHEHAVLEATLAISEPSIRKALRLDPLVSPHQVNALTLELLGLQGY